MGTEELKQHLQLPPVSQVGLTVRDLDRAVRYYEQILGLGPFVRKRISFSEVRYHGEPVDAEWLHAFCSLGPIELELAQPVAGRTIHREFLDTRGEGLHHLGFDVQDIAAHLETCARLGIEVLQSGKSPTGAFAYLDTERIGGVIFELIQRPARRA